MKKIVGIIAALALASAVFADPDVTPSVSKFDGSATLEWVADLEGNGTDVMTGMANSQTAEFEIKFVAAGDKATTGDGWWGDLKIKVGDDVKVASGGTFTVPSASVDHAKIHFLQDDVFFNIDIINHDLNVGGGDNLIATSSAKAFPKKGVDLTGAAGFTANFGLKDLLSVDLAFADNGIVVNDAKEFGFKLAATLDGKGFDVEGLKVYAGFAYSTAKTAAGDSQDAAIAANAAYKLGIGDSMFLKPFVGFAMQGDAKDLGAGLLFGWGKDEGADANFAKFKGTAVAGTKSLNDDGTPKTGDITNIGNKCVNGVSAYISSDLEDGTGIDLLFGFYDDTLLKDVLPGLKMAAQFYGNTESFDDFFEFDAAVAYSNAFGDDIKLTPSFNFGVKLQKQGDETKNGLLYAAGLDIDGLIENTTLYIKYVDGQTAEDIFGGDFTAAAPECVYKGTNNKGKVKLGAKIHF